MLACSCPHCGAPTPLSLAVQTVRCRHCGYDGPPPPQVARQMAAAAGVLGQIDVRQRQLSASEIGAAVSERGSRSLFGALVVFVLLPLSACGGCGVYTSVTNERPLWGLVGVTLAPLVVMSVVVALARIYVRRRQRAFQLACAAVPPAVTGGAAACHVCGAELMTSTDAVARCAYCGADNVVATEILERAAQATVILMDGFEAEVRRRATSVKEAARRASAATLGLGCVTPVVVLAAFFALEWYFLTDYEAPLYREYDYAVVSTPKGKCVCRVQRSGDRYFLHFGNVEGIESEHRDSVDDLELHQADFFEGERVHLPDRDQRGEVARAYGAWHGGVNYAVVDTDDGAVRVTVNGLCLEE